MIRRTASLFLVSATAAMSFFTNDTQVARSLGRTLAFMIFALNTFFFLALATVIVLSMFGVSIPNWVVNLFFREGLPHGIWAVVKLGLGVVIGLFSALVAVGVTRAK